MAQDVATRSWSNTEVRPKFPERALKLPVSFEPSLNLAAGQRLGKVLVDGKFKAYAAAPASTATVSNVALTSNVATITTSAAHGLLVGEIVVITGLTTTALNVTATIASVPSSTTFTFALTHANITSGADSGTVTYNDGSETWLAVLPVAIQTDSGGNITLSSTSGQSGGEFSETYKTYPVWFNGDFNQADLDGMDATCLSSHSGAIVVKGSIAGSNALIHLP